MQMALDLNQRSYDLFGQGGALFGQSHLSPQWADANTERRIRQPSLAPSPANRMPWTNSSSAPTAATATSPWTASKAAANAYHLNLSRTAAGAQAPVLYTLDADQQLGQRWANLPAAQQAPIVEQLTQSLDELTAANTDPAATWATGALFRALTGDPSGLEYLTGARYSSGASGPRMARGAWNCQASPPATAWPSTRKPSPPTSTA